MKPLNPSFHILFKSKNLSNTNVVLLYLEWKFLCADLYRFVRYLVQIHFEITFFPPWPGQIDEPRPHLELMIFIFLAKFTATTCFMCLPSVGEYKNLVSSCVIISGSFLILRTSRIGLFLKGTGARGATFFFFFASASPYKMAPAPLVLQWWSYFLQNCLIELQLEPQEKSELKSCQTGSYPLHGGKLPYHAHQQTRLVNYLSYSWH